MVLLIGYDLKTPGKDYNDLYKAIKSYGTWWHHLDSTWIISTSKTPKQVANDLRNHMDDNDNLLVIRVTNDPKYAGWLPDKAWEWLNARVY